MQRLITCMAAAGLIAAYPAHSAWAALDGLEVARVGAAASLHWENVSSAPYLVSASKTQSSGWRGLHSVELNSRSDVVVHLPAQALLRVMLEEGPAHAPLFQVSDGTGLAVQQRAVASADGKSWLLRSDSARPVFVHIRRAANSGDVQRVVLLLARHEAPREVVAYRHELSIPGAHVRVRAANETTARRYARVAADQVLEIPVHGPERVMLEYRADGAPVSAGVLNMELNLGEQPLRQIRDLIGPDQLMPAKIGGSWVQAGARKRIAIDVPAGEHRLRVRSSHGVLLRAARSGGSDGSGLLLPRLNMPSAWQEQASDTELENLEQSSIAAAMSNQWREIGVLAAHKLREQARARPGMASVEQAQREMEQAFTRYRDLLPDDPNSVEVRSILMQTARAPGEAPEHRVLGMEPAPLPQARFHRIGTDPVRFSLPAVGHPLRLRALLPRDATGVQLVLTDERGNTTTLSSDVQTAQADALRVPALTAGQDAGWPLALDGLADRLDASAPALQVASTEWTVPAGVRSLSVRTLNGEAALALQWQASARYEADDGLLAAMVRNRAQPGAGAPAFQAASLPLQRMLEAAYLSFTANVAPMPKDHSPVKTEEARAALDAASGAKDPALALPHWQQALRAEHPELRTRALRGQIATLLDAGERFAAERILRARWIGDDAVLAGAAAEELATLYRRENDLETALLFASARAVRDPSQLPLLAALLSADGQDGRALLAGLAAPGVSAAALLHSALRARNWQTFDALLEQLDHPADAAFWRGQRALSLGEFDEAARLFTEADADDWSEALADGRAISAQLIDAGADQAAAVQRWLQWQTVHPGPRVWRDEAGSVLRHAGGVSLRSMALDIAMPWWRASARQPLVAQVVGPARIRVEARPVHRVQGTRLDGWLRVKAANQLWLQAFNQNQAASDLDFGNGTEHPGTAVVRDITLPAGLHELQIEAGEQEVIARLQIERPALQIPVLPAPAAAHFKSGTIAQARQIPSAACMFNTGCALVPNRSLLANQLEIASMDWQGLPAPAPARDPAAAWLAAGDTRAALEQASDPAERMRLLRWLAETVPAQRTQALAEAAQLAKAHDDREIRSHWNQLQAGGRWSLLPVVDRSAGLRRIEVARGTPESPAARLRAAMLPALREGEIRIGPHSQANLLLNNERASALLLEAAVDEMPGEPALPVQLSVTRNGKEVETRELSQLSGTVRIDIPVPAGEQQVSVALKQAYVNQSLRLRFSGSAQPEAQVVREWHIATPAQPVQATLAGPVWVRIDRLDGNSVQSEERLMAEPMSRLLLAPHAGSKESLYRIHQLRADPAASQPVPVRPNAYTPTAMPEAPQPWNGSGAGEGLGARQLRFIDAEPLSPGASGTLSLRASAQSRRNTDAGGGRRDLPMERYAETGLSWRMTNQSETRHLLADAFVRKREIGDPVLGFKLNASQEFGWTPLLAMPFAADVSLRGFSQNTPHGRGTAMAASAALYQNRTLTSTLSHRPTVEMNWYSMNLDGVANPLRVDTDVFSSYRLRHLRAFTISDRLSWRPWRDTHLSARLSATTNADLDLSRIDHHQLELQWRQLVGPVILEAGGRLTRYWEDIDRPAGTTRREIHLGAAGEWWPTRGNRVEVRGQVRRDLDTSVTWGGVELRWHWGPGRQLRDFSPAELDFGALRSWRMPNSGHRMEEE